MSAVRDLALLVSEVRHIEKLRAEGLDLLLHGRAYVRSLDHGAQALGRRDGLKAGHPRAQDQHARSLNSPGRRHEHGEELADFRGREHHRLVACDVRLG